MSRIVDFHAHPVTDEFRKAMEYLGINPIEDDGFPLLKGVWKRLGSHS